MAGPQIAATTPSVLQLDAGTCWWCRCGRWDSQPFCDGSHAGTEFGPVRLEIGEPRRVALCRCKRTGDGPFCDGTHSSL